MIDKELIIYTNVVSAISSLCTHTSNTIQTVPNVDSDFPFTYISQIDNPETCEDLSGDEENAVEPMIEIKTYTKGNLAYFNAKQIHNLAGNQMKKLGFHRTFGVKQIDNVSDSTITQVIARYSRLIGSGDNI